MGVLRHGRAVLLCACILMAPGLAVSDAPGETPFLQAAAAADLSAMPAFFQRPGTAGNPLLQELGAGFEARFVQRSEDLNPRTGIAFVDGVVTAFRAYWADALIRPAATQDAERQLVRQLGELSRLPSPGTGSADAVFGAVDAKLREAGYGVSLSRSAPLSDLVLWSDEERRFFRVDLTDSSELVEVVFVDDLVSQGWRHFASLGLNATSGWTSGEALYCIRWAYDPGSEHFRVSYLKHEARHFADFRRFPGLDEDTMEYRAKLTELAYSSSTTAILLRRFAIERDPRGASAHARANERIAQDMYAELFGHPMPERADAWAAVDVQRVNRAARTLLERNTKSLEDPATSGD